jgi:hypothetical protein
LEKIVNPLVNQTYGNVKTDKPTITFIPLSQYQKLANKVGFQLVDYQDITSNTLPTYPLVNKVMNPNKEIKIDMSTQGLEFVSRNNLIRYVILRFQK